MQEEEWEKRFLKDRSIAKGKKKHMKRISNYKKKMENYMAQCGAEEVIKDAQVYTWEDS